MADEMNNELLGLTADIVAAHVANNPVATNEVSELIAQVHSALSGLTAQKVVEEPEQQPAVPIRSSVKHDYIVCLEDGKKLKMLKRYLRTNYNMTPEDYKAKWKLPRDYPMVAPAYAEQRRGLAQAIGLGRKKAEETTAAAPTTSRASAKAKPDVKVSDASPAADAAPTKAVTAKKPRTKTKPAPDATAEEIPAAPKRGRKPKAVTAEGEA